MGYSQQTFFEILNTMTLNKPFTVTDIYHITKFHIATIERYLKHLLLEKHILVKENRNDLRSKNYFITPKGQQYKARLRKNLK